MLALLSATDGANAILQFHYFALGTVLAGGAGIRATLPLFFISLFHIIDPDKMPLSPEMEWLGYWFVCVLLLILLVVEILADMIPAVDHALHTILTPIHPIAGAVAAAAPTYSGGFLTHAPMALAGAGLALTAHTGKSMFRATSSATTGGTMNPLSSICGTLGTTVAIILAILVAVLSIILAMVVIGLCIYACRHGRRRVRSAREAGLAVMGMNRFRRAGQEHAEARGHEMQPGEVASAAEPAEARAQPLVAESAGAVEPGAV
mmetsp:Transcript_74773/g.167543  ORF Transcript_74773/g.167543 Transcript_74773/m.167543 type:complete len:263 (-) Transcript_74773:71-859(-)